MLYGNTTVLLAQPCLTPQSILVYLVIRERMTYDQYVPALDDRFESIDKEEFKNGFKLTLLTLLI